MSGADRFRRASEQRHIRQRREKGQETDQDIGLGIVTAFSVRPVAQSVAVQ